MLWAAVGSHNRAAQAQHTAVAVALKYKRKCQLLLSVLYVLRWRPEPTKGPVSKSNASSVLRFLGLKLKMV
jgi:hypothetical protein